VPFEGLSKVAQRVCDCQCEGCVGRHAWKSGEARHESSMYRAADQARRPFSPPFRPVRGSRSVRLRGADRCRGASAQSRI